MQDVRNSFYSPTPGNKIDLFANTRVKGSPTNDVTQHLVSHLIIDSITLSDQSWGFESNPVNAESYPNCYYNSTADTINVVG